MVLTPAKPKGAMTGARYIESLRDGREVWLDGGRVDDVTTHPAFRDMIKALADVYDLQNSDEYRDQMTYIEPESGLRTSLSWLIPEDHEDSARKRRNSQLWNMLTWGQLGRSPDILAPYISNMVPRREQFSAFKNLSGITDQSLNILGPYIGKLANNSDRVAIERNDFIDHCFSPVGPKRSVLMADSSWPSATN